LKQVQRTGGVCGNVEMTLFLEILSMLSSTPMVHKNIASLQDKRAMLLLHQKPSQLPMLVILALMNFILQFPYQSARYQCGRIVDNLGL